MLFMVCNGLYSDGWLIVRNVFDISFFVMSFG